METDDGTDGDSRPKWMRISRVSLMVMKFLFPSSPAPHLPPSTLFLLLCHNPTWRNHLQVTTHKQTLNDDNNKDKELEMMQREEMSEQP